MKHIHTLPRVPFYFNTKLTRLCLVLLCVLSIFCLKNIYAQNTSGYLDYYKKCIEAHKKYHQEKYDEGAKLYTEAFQGIPYIHIKKYKRVLECSKKFGDKNLKNILTELGLPEFNSQNIVME